jgi:uncharacterized protein YggT (Ycf19 family)
VQDSTKLSVEKFGRALVYLVYFFVLVSLVILVFAFFLLLFGANPDASFTEWIYRAMDKVMAPFRGIFKPVNLNGDSVLDTSVLFAMIVYGIVGLALRALIDWLTYRIGLIGNAAAAAQTQDPGGSSPS